MRPIYLDYNATTPVHPEVLQAMLPYFGEHFGNPSSEHAFGWAADEAVKQAREQVATMLGCQTRNLIFTSGATEAVNLAIKGTAAAYAQRPDPEKSPESVPERQSHHRGKNHVVTVATEHKAVLEACAALKVEDWEVTVLPVKRDGLVDLEVLRESVTDSTLMVSVMAVNSETGVVQPLREIARIAHEKGALMMTDATQAPGKIPIDVDEWGVDLLALSAHKMYGPKGVGVLYRRLRKPRVNLIPQLSGGGHESGLRSGTPNVAGIVGMGHAALLAEHARAEESARLEDLRKQLEEDLLAAVPGAYVNGSDAPRVTNTTNITFPGARMRDVFPRMRGVAVSTGSACQTTSARPSHVLTAMGLSDEDAFSTVRISLGRPTTTKEVQAATDEIIRAVRAD